MSDLAPAPGFVEARLQAEFPGLRLDWLSVSISAREESPEIRRRLRGLSDRFRGANVVSMRTQPVPRAYRTFFRHIGLDPDGTRTPIEEAAVTRLLHGQFRSRDLLADVLLIALIETGVPVWALDANVVEVGGLGIRTSVVGEPLGVGGGEVSRPGGGEAVRLGADRLVVADSRSVHGLLFGTIAPGHAAGPSTREAVLFAVGVDGVPAVHVEESLWTCVEALEGG